MKGDDADKDTVSPECVYLQLRILFLTVLFILQKWIQRFNSRIM